MNDSQIDTPQESPSHRAQKGVLCAKCEHLNPPGRDVCEYCHSHLFLSCKFCGIRNERARTRCVECGHRLHRGFLYQLRRKLALGKKRYMLVYMPLVVIAAYLVYRLVIFIVEFQPRH